MSARTHISTIAIAAAVGLTLVGCGASTGEPEGEAADQTVTLIVHDSFPEEDFAAAASAATGLNVEVFTAGDGGELTNQLVLTKGEPLADAFFGVDNTFATRLIEHDVVDAYSPNEPEPREEAFDIAESLTAVDYGYTCVNVDAAWFAEAGTSEPTGYADLTDPAYRDLTVLIDPAASSVGANFLIGTVSAFGEDGYEEYWEALMANGARVESGWSEAFYGQYSGASEDGTRPIVVSYNTSPTATLNEDETESTTRALLDTCTTQVEYAGVLKGAQNPSGAEAVVDYLVSPEFQATIPDSMYMYPTVESAPLPASWESFAEQPQSPSDLTPEEIGAGREDWLRTLDAVLAQ